MKLKVFIQILKLSNFQTIILSSESEFYFYTWIQRRRFFFNVHCFPWNLCHLPCPLNVRSTTKWSRGILNSSTVVNKKLKSKYLVKILMTRCEGNLCITAHVFNDSETFTMFLNHYISNLKKEATSIVWK